MKSRIVSWGFFFLVSELWKLQINLAPLCDYGPTLDYLYMSRYLRVKRGRP